MPDANIPSKARTNIENLWKPQKCIPSKFCPNPECEANHIDNFYPFGISWDNSWKIINFEKRFSQHMHLSKSKYFQILLCVLAVILAIPCSMKRELKQMLKIENTQQTSPNSQKTIPCSNFLLGQDKQKRAEKIKLFVESSSTLPNHDLKEFVGIAFRYTSKGALVRWKEKIPSYLILGKLLIWFTHGTKLFLSLYTFNYLIHNNFSEKIHFLNIYTSFIYHLKTYLRWKVNSINRPTTGLAFSLYHFV